MVSIRGADVFARAMVDNGVDLVTNIAGLGMWDFVSAVHARRDRIRYVSGVNETSIALIAEGWGRAARRPALCCVYFSSGTQLASVALSTAWADRVPLVLVTMSQAQPLSLREGYAGLPGPATSSLAQFTKWSAEISSPRQLPDVIGRAVRIATAPPMGPVHLALPYDLLSEEFDSRLFDVTSGTTEVLPGPVAEAAVLDRLAGDLLASERPVILAGGEVGQYFGAADLEAIAGLTGAVVVGPPGGPTYLPVPIESTHYAGAVTGHVELLDEADFLFLAGFDFTEVEPHDDPLYRPGTRAGQLATTPLDIGKQVWPAYAGWGDLGLSLRDLRAVLEERIGPRRRLPWRPGLLERRQEAAARRARAIRLDPDSPMPLEHLLSLLPDHFGERLTIVAHGPVNIDTYPKLGTDRYYGISSKASMQGWGLPAGIGVQLARPDERVVVVVGDGGFMFTSGALYTAARLAVPVTVVVVNNQGWGSGGYNFRIEGGEEGDLFVGGFDNPQMNLAQLAEGLGVRSFRVERCEQAEPALREVVAEELPALIEVVVPPETMRRMHRQSPARTRGMSGGG